MTFAEGGYPQTMATSDKDSSGVLGMLMALMTTKRDDHGDRAMMMMFLFIVFVVIIIIILALMWGRHGNTNAGNLAETVAITEALKHKGNECNHEHWDLCRDSHNNAVEMKNSFFASAMQAERHNAETNRHLDQVRHDTAVQTMTILGDAKDREIRELQTKVMEKTMHENTLETKNYIDHAIASIVQTVAPRPVPVNQIYGQVPIPAAIPGLHPGFAPGLV